MRRIPYRTMILQRIFVATVALAVFLIPVLTVDARASEPRWYVGLSVPVMFLDDSESVTSGTNNFPGFGPVSYRANAVNEYKAGFKVSGMVGREFGNGFRLQVEGFFARANLSKLTYTGQRTTVQPLGELDFPERLPIGVSGPADQLGAMVNVWYDFNEGSRWRPFIGGGLGFVMVDWGGVDYQRGELERTLAEKTGFRVSCLLARQPPGCSLPPQDRAGVIAAARAVKVPDLSDTDTVFAFKVGGGLGYELTNHITLQASYRFFKANQLEFNGRDDDGNVVKATSDLQGHLFEVGVRYRF